MEVIFLLFAVIFMIQLVRFLTGKIDIHGNRVRDGKVINKNKGQIESERFMREMQEQDNQRFMNEQTQQHLNQLDVQRRATEESLKSITPFEHGGYDMNQGNSFNMPNNNMNGF